ncbi:uncharacterized protein OCT59_015223 [Rhizophagus irregularis]|nr:hypothetical protein OCT59_015223 [Rhizophagus irregularis]GBC18933.2 hypothetical protein GLOIN_2v1430842 [Rhizophagus irregularis DAOM 181602=DAOM 197198]
MEISDNHTNQVYCRCSLCAENGYGGAWVSRNTRSRHMKTERANRYQYSKPLNSELTSDDANTSSSTETQMSILEDNEYNTDNSTEIQIPIEDSLSGTTSENDHVIYDLDNSFENSSDELLSSSSSMMSYDEVSSDSSSVTDILQQEYDISESLLSALRFLKVKIEHNLTDEAFQETMMAFNSNPISLHTVKKQLKSIVHIEPIWIDMCLNSCCAYTESYRKLTKCPVCGSERFQHKKPCKQYSYFSLIERLTIQYRNYDRAKELRYRTNYTSQKLYKCNIQIGDVFDGDHYKELVQNGHFQDERDVALLASVDEIRVKKDNFLMGAIIPGPKEPKDFNSFLAPIVSELQELERSNWIRRNETWARVNYSVLVYLEVDIYSNNQRRTPVFEKRPFYGNIEYYLMYEFNNEKSMLAYINWTASVSTDSVGLKYFTKFAGYDFIDVIAVERCVGFIKVDNKYYIVDKEANNTIM